MNGFKGIFTSKGVWANLIGLLAATPLGAKVLGGVDTSAMLDAASVLITAGSQIAAAYFRVMATKQLTLSGNP